MKGLAELVVSLCDLCEAEGRLLEAGILRTVRRAALLSLGLLFGAAALALLLVALYGLLTSLLPAPAALALLGGVSAAVAALLLWSARGAGARDARETKPEARSGKPGAPETAREPALPAPKTARAAPESRDLWTGVAPYGRRAGPDIPTKPGRGASPKAAPGMQEKR